MYHTVIVENNSFVSHINQLCVKKDNRFTVDAILDNAEAAFSYLEHHAVDLLLLDLCLPGFGGLELIREMRAQNLNTDVIVITAANDAASIDSAFKLGITDYLIKPYDNSRFHMALDRFASRHKTVHSQKYFSQADIDRIVSSTPTFTSNALPKGLQDLTLEKIRYVFQSDREVYWACEEIADRVNLSRVTVRRYLCHMHETNELISYMNYHTGGRPCLLYQYNQRHLEQPIACSK